MSRLRLLALLATVPFISGWFCVSVPMGMFDSGNACVAASSYVGQRIHDSQNGKWGVVKELQGRHQRCQSAIHPVKAYVEWE